MSVQPQLLTTCALVAVPVPKREISTLLVAAPSNKGEGKISPMGDSFSPFYTKRKKKKGFTTSFVRAMSLSSNTNNPPGLAMLPHNFVSVAIFQHELLKIILEGYALLRCKRFLKDTFFYTSKIL